MGSPAISPASPAAGAMPPAGGASPQPSPGGGDKGPVAQRLARLRMDAQSIAGDASELAPIMREIDEQLNKASLKLIQTVQQKQQASPAI